YSNKLLNAWENRYRDSRTKGIAYLQELCRSGAHLVAAESESKKLAALVDKKPTPAAAPWKSNLLVRMRTGSARRLRVISRTPFALRRLMHGLVTPPTRPPKRFNSNDSLTSQDSTHTADTGDSADSIAALAAAMDSPAASAATSLAERANAAANDCSCSLFDADDGRCNDAADHSLNCRRTRRRQQRRAVGHDSTLRQISTEAADALRALDGLPLQSQVRITNEPTTHLATEAVAAPSRSAASIVEGVKSTRRVARDQLSPAMAASDRQAASVEQQLHTLRHDIELDHTSLAAVQLKQGR
ncbi:hypothetical protein BIW11_06853, partial [Tropilaelaps mercedesae]